MVHSTVNRYDIEGAIEMIEAALSKGGEMCIETSLKRTPLGLMNTERSSAGLMVTIRAHPRVEEFMRELGGGEQVNVSNIGRHWYPIDNRPLRAYVITPLEPMRTTDHGLNINLDRLGWPLIDNDEHTGMEQVNLSFLRLVGISEGIGVSFLVKSVFSLPALARVRDHIQNAQQTFYVGYIRPVDYTVTTNSQMLKL